MIRTRLTMVVLALGVAAVSSVAPRAQGSPQRALRAAEETDAAKGCPAAIEGYKAAASGNDGAVAAEALVRLGGCYSKMGDEAGARGAFDELARRYPDQKLVADLQRKSPDNTRPAESYRRIWTMTGDDVSYGNVSRDGRLVPFTRYLSSNGELFLHDLVTGVDRQVTFTPERPVGEYAEMTAFSRDGRRLAYAWFNGKGRFDLRVVDLQSGSVPRPDILYGNEEIEWIYPFDWSRDGQWLAVLLKRKDQVEQAGLLSVSDRRLRVLTTTDWRGVDRLMFSPDGRFLAFDRSASSDDEQRDIVMLATDGSGGGAIAPHPLHDRLIGFSGDGSTLFFVSDRSGVPSLWSVPISNGRALAEPVIVNRDVGQFVSLGLTDDGSLYTLRGDPWDSGASVEIADIDLARGGLISNRRPALQRVVGSNHYPDWSPSGTHLAYISRRYTLGSSPFFVAIHSLADNTVVDVPLTPGFQYVWSLRWIDERSFIVDGVSAGRSGAFRVDAQTGRTTPVVLSSTRTNAGSSLDGRTLFYVRDASEETAPEHLVIMRRDIESGTESEIVRDVRGRFGNDASSIAVSPDGRWIAATRPQSSKFRGVILVPSGGGPVREVSSGGQQRDRILAWAPDSRSVLVVRQGTNPKEVWQVPLDGVAVALTSILGPDDVGIRLSPDGRRVAFYKRSPRLPAEVWKRENFLPAAPSQR